MKVKDKITDQYTYKISTKDAKTNQTIGDYNHVTRAFAITVNVGDKVSFSGVTLCSPELPELFFSIFITDVFGNWKSSVQKR
jgi:hypothetical protein